LSKYGDFDYVIFDLPPAKNAEVKAIIRVSDCVYVPIVMDRFSIEGLMSVTEEINAQKAKLGGVFITIYSEETDGKFVAECKNILKNRLMHTIIPQSKTVRKSQVMGLPLGEYFDKTATPPTNARKMQYAYEELTEEIVGRCE
jgi:chromosome partitioning protein